MGGLTLLQTDNHDKMFQNCQPCQKSEDRINKDLVQILLAKWKFKHEVNFLCVLIFLDFS